MKHYYTTLFFIILSSLTLRPAMVAAQCPIAAGCTPGRASNAQAAAFGMGIFRVRFGSIDTTTAGNADGYQNYSCTQRTRLVPGLSYPINITTNANTNENVRVWLDYNNDGNFDPVGELLFSSNAARQHTGVTAAIPATAVLGVRLRLRVAADAQSSPLPAPCSTPQYSQTEDYGVLLGAPTQPPVATFAINATQACSGVFGFADRSQSLPTMWRWTFGDGTTSTQQSPSHTYSQAGTYAVKLRACNAFGCDSSQQTVTYFGAYPTAATCRPATLSYCCNYGITRVDFGDLSQASADGQVGYEDYSCINRTTVTQGQLVPLRVVTAIAQDTWVYLDGDNDGAFTSSELLYQALSTTTPQAFVAIPRTTLTNQPLRLRIISDAPGVGGTPCADRTSGQVEDYTVVVTPTPCPAVVQGGRIEFFATAATSLTTVDSVASALLLTRYTPGATIQWERSPNVTPPVWQALAGHTGPTLYYKRLNSAPDSLYRAVVTCGGTPVASTNTVRTVVSGRNPLHAYGCSATTPLYIQRVRLVGTSLDNASTCANSGGAAYQLFNPAQPTRTATVVRGATYELEVTTTRSCRLTVYAQTQDLLQLPVLQVPATAAGTPTRVFLKLDSLLLPASATVLRLRVRCDQAPLFPNVGYDWMLNSGETEEYLLRVAPFACAAAVASGTVLVPTLQCARDSFQLTLAGASPAGRVQWQTSTDNLTWQAATRQTDRVFTTRLSSTTYYRAQVQGCTATATSPAVRVQPLPIGQCYCAPATASVPSTAPVITRVRILGTTLNNASPAGSGTPGRVLYAPTQPALTAELVRGGTYTLELTVDNPGTGATVQAAAWLDLNRNSSYDSLEWVQLVRASVTGRTTTYQAALPVGVWAQLGAAGLRLRVGNNWVYRPLQACAEAGAPAGRGETEDYTVTLIAPPCQGTLTAGVVDLQYNLTGVCRSRLRSTSYTPGAVLQWQRSLGGQTWMDIADATADEYVVWAAATYFYRIRATCGGATAYSPAVQPVDVSGTVPCGCATDAVRSSQASNYVDDVEIVGTTLVNINSGIQLLYTSPPSTSLYRTVGQWAPQTAAFTATLLRGSSYQLRLAAVGGPGLFGAPGPGTTVGAWIDWNHNGTFETTEYYGAPPTGVGRVNYTATLAVPATAPLGATLMRVRATETLMNTYGCGFSGDAETEDYFLTIADQAPLPVPVLTAGPQPLCQGATLQLSVSGAGAGSRVDWLGPAGFSATNTTTPTRSNVTTAHGGTYIAVVTRNGERLLTSVYVPVDTCRAPLGGRLASRAATATVYPNPSTGWCTVRLPSIATSPVGFLVRNTTGQLISVPTPSWRPGAEGLEAQVDLRSLPVGLYVLEMRTEQGSLFGKVVRE